MLPSLSLELVQKVIVYQAIILLSIFFVTAIIKFSYNIFKKKRIQKQRIWRKKIINFLSDSKEKNFPLTHEFQDYLAKYALNFKGKYRRQLDSVYIKNGFLEVDKKNLFSFSRSKRFKALRRMNNLDISLPLDFLEDVLKSDDKYFCSEVLFHMIKSYKKKSAPYILNFIHNNEKFSKGILINLLKNYGIHDPEGLKFLLNRVENNSLQEAILTAIYFSPVEDVDHLVMLNVKNSSPLQNKIMALKVLDKYKTQNALTLIKILAEQKEWIIKIYLAKLMYSYDYTEVRTLLNKLLEEENFHVRKSACVALLNFRPQSNEDIEKILINPVHPVKEILHHELSVEQVEVNYVA